ncbi:MAG: helix-turn-helix transcriptional regulator [Hyphomicrobiaceae bacterium]
MIERLAEARHARRMSLAEVGRRLDLHGSAVGGWERHERFPASLSTWQDWARAVGLRFEIGLIDPSSTHR